jgi:hypothetical protein
MEKLNFDSRYEKRYQGREFFDSKQGGQMSLLKIAQNLAQPFFIKIKSLLFCRKSRKNLATSVHSHQ